MDFLTLMVILTCILGYLLGSANSSLIVGKFYGVDVRKHGSGNAGATNTLRTIGKKATAFVAVGDILKGIIACLIGLFLVGYVDKIGWLGVMVGGISAIIGHNWPVYFGFKGGKGIFTSLAVIMFMDWRIGLILFGVFVIIVAITRYISLGSILGAVLFPFVAAIPVFGKSITFVIFAFILGSLAVIRHQSNIERILKGTESKFGAGKKG